MKPKMYNDGTGDGLREFSGKLYPKIDIYVVKDGHWSYRCSTNWSRTLKEAKARWFAQNHGHHIDNIKAKFDRRPA